MLVDKWVICISHNHSSHFIYAPYRTSYAAAIYTKCIALCCLNECEIAGCISESISVPMSVMLPAWLHNGSAHLHKIQTCCLQWKHCVCNSQPHVSVIWAQPTLTLTFFVRFVKSDSKNKLLQDTAIYLKGTVDIKVQYSQINSV